MTTRTVDLGYDQLLVLESQRGAVVRVLQGNLWLTQEGRTQDVFAGSGSEVTLQREGRTVIEALGTARVQVIEPRLGSVLRRTVAWLRERMRAGGGARRARGTAQSAGRASLPA